MNGSLFKPGDDPNAKSFLHTMLVPISPDRTRDIEILEEAQNILILLRSN